MMEKLKQKLNKYRSPTELNGTIYYKIPENVIDNLDAVQKELIIETFRYAQVLHAMGDEMRAEQYYYNLINNKNGNR